MSEIITHVSDLAFSLGKTIGTMGRQDVKKYFTERGVAPEIYDQFLDVAMEISNAFYFDRLGGKNHEATGRDSKKK